MIRKKRLNFDKLDVIYIHQHFRTPGEAGGTRSWEFARRLASDGHKVTIISGGQRDFVEEIDGIKIVRISAPYSNEMGTGRRIRSFLQFAIKAILKTIGANGDIIYATSTPLTVVVPAYIASRFKRIPYVFEVRDLWPSVPARLGFVRSSAMLRLAQALERFAYTRARRIVALSPGMREGVLQIAPMADVRLIPNAADLELFDFSKDDRRKIRDELHWCDKPVVVYAGSFGSTYLIPWIVRLAASCPEMRFVIIGEGSSSQEAHALAEQLGLDTENVLPGKLSKLEVARRVSASDLVLSSLLDHPALHSNSLNKVFDAMAAGRPVVFNHGGWLADLVSSRSAGWILPTDLGDASNRLRELLADRGALDRAGAEALALARSDFSRDEMYERFRDALHLQR